MHFLGLPDTGVGVQYAGDKGGEEHCDDLRGNADAEENNHQWNPGEAGHGPQQVEDGSDEQVHLFIPGHENAQRGPNDDTHKPAAQSDLQGGADMLGQGGAVRRSAGQLLHEGLGHGDGTG